MRFCGAFVLPCSGGNERLLMMVKLLNKCFLHGETMGAVVLSFMEENVGGAVLWRAFFADMKKGERGMRKRLCGVKWAYWGKGGGRSRKKIEEK